MSLELADGICPECGADLLIEHEDDADWWICEICGYDNDWSAFA